MVGLWVRAGTTCSHGRSEMGMNARARGSAPPCLLHPCPTPPAILRPVYPLAPHPFTLPTPKSRPSRTAACSTRRRGRGFGLPRSSSPPPSLPPLPLFCLPPFPLFPPSSSLSSPPLWALPALPALLPSAPESPPAESSLRSCGESSRSGREGVKKATLCDPSPPPPTGRSPRARPSPGEAWEGARMRARAAVGRESAAPAEAALQHSRRTTRRTESHTRT